ncbi:MAG: PadR family transcriptional regulator [Thermoproteota archaeon]
MCHRGHYPGRGFIQTLILWIIHKEPLHGYGVRKEIEQMASHYTPKSGAIYTILRRMEKNGLLTSRWNQRTGKKDIRIYHVTEKGEDLLRARLEIMKDRLKLLEQMVSYYHSKIAREK